MTQTERAVAIGSFHDSTRAEQAIRDLQAGGFRDDQIRYSVSRGAMDILDGLSRMGVSPAEAEFYNQEFAAGHMVVVVLAQDRLQEAADILQRNGAAQAHVIQERPDGYTMQVREETLQVFKQWVQTGEVRIRKRVVTENQTFTVPVTREEVIIERVPAMPANVPQSGTTGGDVEHAGDAGISAPSSPSLPDTEGNVVQLGYGESITILVQAEQVRFEKSLAIIEEITVTKRLVQEMRTITETVRKEQVNVEPQGNLRTINNDTVAQAPVETPQG